MGLIKKLKEIFNKNIECGDEINNHIVFPLKKKKWLFLNKNILVKEKCACVIVYKYRMCDVIFEGKHRINQESIPETYSRAKIKKHRKFKIKKIRADIYYVNLKEFEYFTYESDVPFYVKSGYLGRIKGYLEGVCNVKVLDAGAIIKALIHETGRAKLNEISQDIGLWIGNKINHIIDRNKISATQILSEQESVEQLVNTEMQDALDKIGLFVSNVKLKSVNFPKKYQEKINKYLALNQRVIKNFDINTNFGSSLDSNVKVPVMQESNSASKTNTMQYPQKTIKFPVFKECSVCKKINDSNARICIGCGARLD